MTSKTEQVRQQLAQVMDPELGIDIVSLGLIYDIQVAELSQEEISISQESPVGQQQSSTRSLNAPVITITMTLTTPGCPLAPVIDEMVRSSVSLLDWVESDQDIEIILTFDPPWVPDMMSESARAELGR